jgi:hypothetical protein
MDAKTVVEATMATHRTEAEGAVRVRLELEAAREAL